MGSRYSDGVCSSGSRSLRWRCDFQGIRVLQGYVLPAARFLGVGLWPSSSCGNNHRSMPTASCSWSAQRLDRTRYKRNASCGYPSRHGPGAGPRAEARRADQRRSSTSAAGSFPAEAREHDHHRPCRLRRGRWWSCSRAVPVSDLCFVSAFRYWCRLCVVGGGRWWFCYLVSDVIGLVTRISVCLWFRIIFSCLFCVCPGPLPVPSPTRPHSCFGRGPPAVWVHG